MLRKLPSQLFVEDINPGENEKPVTKENFYAEDFIFYADADAVADNADSDEIEGDGVLVGVYKLEKMVRVRRTYKTIVQNV